MACAQKSPELKRKEENQEEESSDQMDAIKEKWTKEQDELKAKLEVEDREEWQVRRTIGKGGLSRVAGVDISFIKDDQVNACASVVVLDLPSLKQIYEKCTMVRLTAPYIPGFLAFREVPHLVELVNEIPTEKRPQLILVDGNGILHPRGFGLACHLGVLLDLPAMGVAKNLYHVDGLNRHELLEKFASSCSEKGDTMDIIGDSGTLHGKAYQSTGKSSRNPIFVSMGHRISLDTAIWVTGHCCKHKIPEPIRQADLSSREYIRQKTLKGELPEPGELPDSNDAS